MYEGSESAVGTSTLCGGSCANESREEAFRNVKKYRMIDGDYVG